LISAIRDANPRITIKLNGVVINRAGEFVHHPWACQGGGDGNFYIGRANQLVCS
jgi:hypothetical protein